MKVSRWTIYLKCYGMYSSSQYSYWDLDYYEKLGWEFTIGEFDKHRYLHADILGYVEYKLCII